MDGYLGRGVAFREPARDCQVDYERDATMRLYTGAKMIAATQAKTVLQTMPSIKLLSDPTGAVENNPIQL